jgi:hypothetical protein
MGDSPEDQQRAFSLISSPAPPGKGGNPMSEQWTLDGWFYMKTGNRIGPVLPEYIAFLIRAEELRPHEKVFQGWKKGQDYRFTECEALIA